jgi:hypothetical protein
MTGMTWIGFLITLAGGGAMGAIIKIMYDYKQNRIQAVRQRIKVFPLFHHTDKPQNFSAVVSVTHDGSIKEYKNLFVADITITNRSNKDYDDFEFGADLEKDECIYVAWENPDQHHTLTPITIVSPSAPASKIKFQLSPFNRTNSYSLRLYLTLNEDGREPTLPQLTARQSVQFIDELSKDSRYSLLEFPVLIFTTGLLFAVTAFLWRDTQRLKDLIPSLPGIAENSPTAGSVKFSAQIPFPENLDQVKPGLRLSEVRAAWPEGQLEASFYVVDLKSGPFSQKMANFFTRENDPSIEDVAFIFRSKESKQATVASALDRFAQFPHRTEVLGTQLIWPNIDGFELTISDHTYSIRKARESISSDKPTNAKAKNPVP